MRRVLVTGATGFIGQHTVPLLVARGFEVHALSRHGHPDGAGIQWHRGSLADAPAITSLLADVRPSHLLHLAWDTSPSYYTTPRNVDWLRDSLALCAAFVQAGGKRIVGAGSSAEYDLAGDDPLTEDATPLRPNGLYGHCKAALHQVVASLGSQAGTEVAWGRVFFCYGPGEDPGRPVPQLVQRLLAGGKVPFQAGRGVRDYVHVHDVAAAFAALVDSPFVGAVNVASGAGVELARFASGLARALGRGEALDLGGLPTPTYEPRRVVASVRRIRDALGWRASVPLDEGLAQTAAYWQRRLEAGT